MAKPKWGSIDEVVRFIEDAHMRIGQRIPICKADYRLVDGAIQQLKSQGRFLDIEVYDIRGTMNAWTGEKRKILARKMTKALFSKIQRDYPEKTPERMLTEITLETFQTYAINRYGTTCLGMISTVYNDSPYEALKDWIDNDDSMVEYRDFKPYDMLRSPLKTWLDKGRKNKKLAREVTDTLVNALRQLNPKKSLSDIILGISSRTFEKHPINKYGTVNGGMLTHVYNGSAYLALNDLASHNEKYQPYVAVIGQKKRTV